MIGLPEVQCAGKRLVAHPTQIGTGPPNLAAHRFINGRDDGCGGSMLPHDSASFPPSMKTDRMLSDEILSDAGEAAPGSRARLQIPDQLRACLCDKARIHTMPFQILLDRAL